MKILEDLKQRGIFKDITNINKFNKLKNEGVYIGFDPTAKSLHLGNYVQIAILKRFKEAGFKPIAVLGGATGMIGDPSGKSEERNLLSDDEVLSNTNFIKKQLEKFQLDVENNLDIYKKMDLIYFLRSVGKLLNVNYMIAKDIVSSRLDSGISYTEFSYQLIQGWDFKTYYETKNVRIQIGGSDQWGNITSGIEMIRKTQGDNNLAVGITTNLLTTKSGKKFGKSEGNAIWLDKKMTSPFQMYQYLLSTTDDDVEKFLKWLTFISIDDVKKIILKHQENKKKMFAQKTLAFEVVKDIHGEEAAEEALTITGILYGNLDISDLSFNQALLIDGSVPTFENLNGNILNVLIESKLASSKREAREFISGGAISVNGKQISDENYQVTNNHFEGKANIIKRGKKKIVLIKY
ncbi:MAG: tyrosine--tRNA ligase [Mycoplasmatales bacterium]|nr:tyrosine--tRNA ligase [Mycoplasmatales bacterium]